MRFNLKKLLLVLVCVSVLPLGACGITGIATTAGAVGGIAAAREGGLRQSAIDTRIAMEINDLWFKYDTEAFLKLNLTVEQGRVLVTGIVQNPDHRVEAIRLAWQPEGVSQVINEVRVADSEGISGFAKDTWVTGNLRAKLIFDRDIQSINYTIDTVSGVVYLMGIAQDQAELNKVVTHARDTGYVKDVVSHVKLAGDPIDEIQDPVGQPMAPQQTYNYRADDYRPLDNSFDAQPLPADPTFDNEYDSGW
jgi:osmotically-inducible protein OsmY